MFQLISYRHTIYISKQFFNILFRMVYFSLQFYAVGTIFYVETGLTNYVLSKPTSKDRPCKADAKPKGKKSAFKLKDFIPAFFFFFCVGCCISLLCFMLELIIVVVFSQRKIKNSTKTVLE